MSYQLIDKFLGSSGTALAGHTPDVGTTAWSSSSTYAYTGSDFRLDGAGMLYNNASGSSLMLWPGAIAANTFEARFTILRKSVVASHTVGIGLWAAASAATYYRFHWDEVDSDFRMERNGAIVIGPVTVALTVGVPYEIRVRVTDGASRAFTWEYSANSGQSWTSLGSYTDTSPLAGSANVAIWIDATNTATTGLALGNLRVGPNPTTPGLTVSPTTFAAGSSGTLTLTGSGTGWKAGTPGAPTFSVSGGTGSALSSQVVTAVDAGAVTLNPGTAAGTLTITDPTGGTATITVSAAGATITKTVTRFAATSYQLYNADGSTSGGAVTTGIRSVGTNGGVANSAVTLLVPFGVSLAIEWRNAGGDSVLDTIDPIPALDGSGRTNVGKFLDHAVVADANGYPGVNVVDVAGSAASPASGVTVVDYASGKDPASLLLTNPLNKIDADTTGKVAANNLPSDYQQRTAQVTLPATPPAGYGGGATPTELAAAIFVDPNNKLAVDDEGRVSDPPGMTTMLDAMTRAEIPFTVVSDPANSTSVFTVSGLAGVDLASISRGTMQVQWSALQSGSIGNKSTHMPIIAAAVNGLNVKLTVAPAFGTVPLPGDVGAIR